VVTALIQFSQGASTPPAGQALMGVTGTPVVVANGNDAGVAKWVFEVIDVPPGSAVPVGIVQSGTTPTWSFTPDLVDGYQIQLTTIDPTGQIMAVDTRVFGVLRTSGGAVVLCSLTTMLGYVALVGSHNAAIRGLGAIAAVGELSCLLAAVLVMPSLWRLAETQQQRGGFEWALQAFRPPRHPAP